MKTIDYIDAAAAKMGWTSDYRIAKELGISTASISKIRHGGGIGNDVAWKVAELLEIDPTEVIAVAELERAERSADAEKAAVWKRRFQAVSHSAATIFGLIALPYGVWLTDRLYILC